MKVSVLIPSYNKGRLTLEGINMILSQTYQDFELLVIDNSTEKMTRNLVRDLCATDTRITFIEQDYSRKEREQGFVGSKIVNEWLPKLKGDLIIYKSDDDLLYPHCFELAVDFFSKNPMAMVGWFSMKTTKDVGGYFLQISDIKADRKIGFDTVNTSVDCMLDGGQIIYRKECLRNIQQPFYPTDWHLASHADGIFMDQLAKQYTFYPITQEYLLEHRRTALSTFTNDKTL